MAMLKTIIKYLLLIIFVSKTACVLHAQDFHGHLIVGGNISQIDGDIVYGYNKAGLVAGMAANYQLKPGLALQLEAYYSQKGALSTRSQMTYYYIRAQLHYVDIPVLLEKSVYKSKVWLQGGLTFASFINGKFDDVGWGIYQNLQPYTKRWDILYTGSVEYYLTDKWILNARFQYSAFPITKDNASQLGFPYVNGWYNNVCQLSVRYVFFAPRDK